MKPRAILLPAACLLIAGNALGSYAIYVGKNLTTDGSVFIGGSGDEVSSHWLEVVPAKDHPAGSTITVGVTAEAFVPGELTEIPQVRRTYRYLTMDYSEYEGFPPPLTNGGLNEHNVAGRDVWSPSRPELMAMTPNPQTGPQYSDLSRIAMERARTAREAVEIIGALMDEYGYSSYGGNSHMFADENEGWGAHQLWRRVRVYGSRNDSVPTTFACPTPDTYMKCRRISGSATTSWDRRISSALRWNRAGTTLRATGPSMPRKSMASTRNVPRGVTWSGNCAMPRRSICAP